MATLLIVYGTTAGQTAKIAHLMAEIAAEHGVAVDVYDGRELPASFSIGEYDGVLVGASVHQRSRYQPCIRAFVKRHRATLERLPSAFFSVCLWAHSRSPRGQKHVNRYLDRFFRETGWRPRTVASFAGAYAYSRYGFATRLILRAIAWRRGGPTDTSRDHEFTDWQQVRQFAKEFVATLSASPVLAASQ